MKLLRLHIGEPFRCLQAGFELHFLREWDRDSADPFAPYVLAGPNGCGKSNILEVLAAIFYQMECQYLTYLPDALAANNADEDSDEALAEPEEAEIRSPNSFELEYLILVPDRLRTSSSESVAHIKISKSPGQSAEMFWLNHPDHGETNPLTRQDARDFLPDYVLGYSSGENEILSLPFFKLRFIQLDEYLHSLKEDLSYGGKPEARHAFLDNAFNQAILVSNLIFETQDILQQFKDEVGVEGLEQFRIVLKKSIVITAAQVNEYPEGFVQVDEGADGSKIYRIPILKKFEPADERDKTALLDRLERCATCSYLDAETDTLYLDYLVTEAIRGAFANNFDSAMDLFQSLQMLLTLNLYEVNDALKNELYLSDSLYVNETVPTLPADELVIRFEELVLKKAGVTEPIYAKSLSDGEYQFLHSLGLCLLYRNSHSLFLLDEPETHFNPDWRSKFITRLRDCFKTANPKVRREVLVTTHTPFLISDSTPEQVLVVNKETSTGIVSVNRPDYNTLGASINKITMKTFGKRETIGGFAQQKMGALKKRFEALNEAGTDAEKNALIDEIELQLGDSVEKMLLIKTILDSMQGSDD
ncbi:restriction system-associated AAA family ATPase [Desulfosarcina ovata]|uniref:ABC transporter n=1 Tax=Desulfosarcina ovata subsp. ovata TaxID=2752305 RepID=A0A5K8AAK0_9BACT|nr:restriction system-associated AAA family ATPase [Desulfosarcina ovata]BBO89625.1 ABC transporter [Desulfosarcina ovata subsp. ovata]